MLYKVFANGSVRSARAISLKFLFQFGLLFVFVFMCRSVILFKALCLRQCLAFISKVALVQCVCIPMCDWFPPRFPEMLLIMHLCNVSFAFVWKWSSFRVFYFFLRDVRMFDFCVIFLIYKNCYVLWWSCAIFS